MTDIIVGNRGRLYFLRPLTERGRAWLRPRVSASLWRNGEAVFEVQDGGFQATLVAALDAGLHVDDEIVPREAPDEVL